MKKLFLFIVCVGLSVSVSANSDLEASMKIIGEQFKAIGAGLQSHQISANELQAVELLQREVAASSLIYPDAATSEALKLQYSKWMAELMQLALVLEDDFELAMMADPQDLSASFATFVAINELRKKGHDQFKPE